ncbi:MAG: recombinase family protein, partial [Candidatus Aadella gelida]|nr:recombinase family protein [Candidatus Aadella gelida]
MEKLNKIINYFIYLRKSSDSEDRQVQSIEAQKRELLAYAKQKNLNILSIFEESKSAKEPGRPVFTEMIGRINKGEANGLLVWKINRLARNPVDGGTISWLLQQNILQNIQTIGQGYFPTDNVIVMAVELGVANQYVRDLSTDTKRGMRERAEKGLTHGVAAIGYLNDLSAEPGDR